MSLVKKYTKTNIFIINEELWKWAKYKADLLSLNSVSEYLFKLIELDKVKELIKKK